MQPKETGRIHLLPAKSAPIVCIIRRKPSKRFHVITWNTSTDQITHGGWIRGKVYVLRSDISFDGQWMVFLVMGAAGTTWNGICKLPWLNTPFEYPCQGTQYGGGYWSQENLLLLNKWQPRGVPLRVPFRTQTYEAPHPEDEGVLFARMERDGWKRIGPFGEMRTIENQRKPMVACDNDPGWCWQPTPAHPTLRAYYRGNLTHGLTFEFALDECPGLLGPDIEWATWDSIGNLITTKNGGVAKYNLKGLTVGQPTFETSFEDLLPPDAGK